MKNTIKLSLLLIIAVAGVFTSCKKDKKADGPCAKLEFKQKAIVDYNRPVAIAISKSGIVAVVGYNGFNAYGTPDITTIWNSYDDFVQKKAPLQTFQSVGAEAVTFDAGENLYIAETEATAGIKTYKKVIQAGVISYHYYSLIQGNDLPGGFVNPRGLAFDDKGRLYLANDGRGNLIRIIDPMGAATKTIIASQLIGPKGLAIIGNTLYMSIYDTGRIAKCTLKDNGEFGAITGIYNVSKPVDIAVKDGVLAISSPESGLITLIDPDMITNGVEPYTGCKKEISVGTRLFGLAFSPTGNTLLAAHLAMNRILEYTN